MLEAALKYVQQGWAVLPLHTVVNGMCTCQKREHCHSPGKHPRTRNGVTDATKNPTDLQTWWRKWPNSNIGLATGQISGRVVLDVDMKKGKRGDKSLDELEEKFGPLPETSKSQTASGGWHLIFAISEKVSTSVTNFREGLDFMANRGYIVAPPSITPKGCYEWVKCGPEADCPEWLLDVVYESKKKKKAFRHKPKEDRSKLIQELLPNGEERNGEWLTNCPFPPHKDNNPSFNVRLVDGVYKCFSCPAQGNLVQLYAHLKGVSIEEASRVVGGKPSFIEELNQRHAVTAVGGKCVILTETWDPVFQQPDIVLSSPQDLRLRYQNRKFFDGKSERPIVDLWLNHPSRRQYEGITFSPTREVSEYFNLWKGFAVEPRPGDCSLYLALLRDIISRKDEAIYQYLVGWMAHAVQAPEERLGVAIVLRGKQGTGKGTMCTEFGKLFGAHFTHVQHSRHLVGHFNGHFKQALVVFADEAFWAGDKGGEGALKAMVTEERLPIEYKGKDVFYVRNYIHLMIASNHEWVVPAGLEERRFFTLDVGEDHMQDNSYFKALINQMNNGGREALLDYLMQYDLKGVNLRKFPQTEALWEQKLQSMDDFQRFWMDKLMEGTIKGYFSNGDSEYMEKEKFYDEYIKHAKDEGQTRRGAATKVGMGLKKLVPNLRTTEEGKRRKIKYWILPSLKVCREHFDGLLNYPCPWPDDGGQWMNKALDDENVPF
jgi:hypothetical protein